MASRRPPRAASGGDRRRGRGRRPGLLADIADVEPDRLTAGRRARAALGLLLVVLVVAALTALVITLMFSG
ncbi:MAG TPA: hypothetical protein VEZ46_01890 [Mycobacteriales bacterium]|nr:hypothetical protein [Mycobacteriales bacterium]